MNASSNVLFYFVLVHVLKRLFIGKRACNFPLVFCFFLPLIYILTNYSKRWQRVPLHLVRGTTSLTHSAVGADGNPSTSRRRHALLAHTQLPVWGDSTGLRKPSGGRPPVLAVACTWRTSTGVSATDSALVHLRLRLPWSLRKRE